MKKTKIICSIGPSSENLIVLTEMAKAGMNVARINFSHGTYEEKIKTVDTIKQLNETLNVDIAILYDTKGPDLRTGVVENNAVKLVPGKSIKLIKERIIGTKQRISVNHGRALDILKVGTEILIDDGLMKLIVTDKDEEGITCDIINGGVLSSRKSINVPGINLEMDFISKQDHEDIIFACQNDGDFLALSFVNNKEDIIAVRHILEENGRSDMQIIAKVESVESINNIDEIIKASDGIMIARGDLGVEVPLSKLPILQKQIIDKCRKHGKICIVATEMMASMYQNARPSRAEISDIANAVFDGTDAVMLSGETTVGKYPVLATKHMAEACAEAEQYYDYTAQALSPKVHNIPATIARNVVESANLLDVKAIVAATKSGYTAKLISNLKPKPPILATCMSHQVAKSLALNYGVYPCVVDRFFSFENIVDTSKEKAVDQLKLSENDLIIITCGTPVLNKEKTTNFMKIERI